MENIQLFFLVVISTFDLELEQVIKFLKKINEGHSKVKAAQEFYKKYC